MRQHTRADRVSELIARNLSEILRKEISDPRLEMVTITGVEMSRDLKNARIYFSTAGTGKDRSAALEGFTSAGGYIKRTLAERLELRYMPELRFQYDESIEYGSRIEKLLKSINEADEPDHRPDPKPSGTE